MSGVVDAAQGVHAEEIPSDELTVCRLRADRDELVRRFTGRGAEVGLVEAVLCEAEAMDASDVADVCVDTSGLSVADAARLVIERAGGWPVLTGRSRTTAAAVPDDGPTGWPVPPEQPTTAQARARSSVGRGGVPG
ncbi:hypothetical protein [Streptomyces sp. NPDC102264]|uniref:hypothetical protein n=1 Tax=Streptomyces sp. NPDC102264 TaxID=3366149 RepID=UPI003817147B